MPSLLDLMPKEEREKAVERGHRRLQKNKNSSISPEIYITAEFGYYFGFEGILAIKRGYIEHFDLGANEVVREPFTLDEVMVLIEAAKKVWFSKVIDSAHGSMVGSSAKYAKKPGDAFASGMRPFIERAELSKD